MYKLIINYCQYLIKSRTSFTFPLVTNHSYLIIIILLLLTNIMLTINFLVKTEDANALVLASLDSSEVFDCCESFKDKET